MDDEAALRARDVAVSAAAWFDAPRNVDAYRRLAEAVDEWKAYVQPLLDAGDGEVLDALADINPPSPLGDEVRDLETRLRRVSRKAL